MRVPIGASSRIGAITSIIALFVISASLVQAQASRGKPAKDAKPTSSTSDAPATEHVFGQAPKGFDETRLMRFRYTATNPGNQTMPEAVFRVTLPVQRTSQQAMLRAVSTVPATLESDTLGNLALKIDVGPLAPYASAVITVTAELAVATSPQPSPLPKGLFIGSEPFIELDAPAVKTAAEKVLLPPKPDATAAWKAQRIYQWVSQNINDTGFYSRERGAQWAIEKGEGDCSEMAFAFVALARANGLPARYMGGYVIESSALLTPEEFHNWAEWWDGQTWRVADPQKGIFDERPQRYISTRLFSEITSREMMRWQAETPELQVKMDGR